MDTDLQRALAFSHAVEDGSATSLIPLSWGTALFNEDFRHSWMHNFLRVDGVRPCLTADELIGEADRLHAAAGHAHRLIVVEDEATGARLQEGFIERGYKVERLLVMVHRRPPDRLADTSIVEELSFESLRPMLVESYRAEPYTDSEESVRQMVDRSRLPAATVDVRHFGVLVDGQVVSGCDLYRRGDIAQIEYVTTLAEHRRRGFARAHMTRALGEAPGADLVFLVADADDWPKELYGKLGFEAIALLHQFLWPIS